MPAYLWIAIGGALGSIGRFWLANFVAERHGETFPWGTLVVNISGCALIGFLAALTAPEGRWAASPAFRQFFMVGICGGYTTFSAFSLQTLNLLRDRAWLYAGGYILLSVTLCLVAVGLGFLAGTACNPVKGN